MTIRLLAGAALLIAAVPVMAQNAPPLGYDRADRHMAPPPLTRAEVEQQVTAHFAALDLNHDGVVTRGEIVDAREAMRVAMMKADRDALFARLDTNKDGMLSRDEFGAPPPGGPDGPGRGGPHGMRRGPEPMGARAMLMMGPHWFDRVDTDHDGKITLAEAKAAALAAFDRVDTNHDGTVSAEERRAVMRAMMEHGPGRDDPDGGPAGD